MNNTESFFCFYVKEQREWGINHLYGDYYKTKNPRPKNLCNEAGKNGNNEQEGLI